MQADDDDDDDDDDDYDHRGHLDLGHHFHRLHEDDSRLK